MGNTAFQYTSAKEANQLADRIIGWNGLCLGILGALARLREVLIKEPLFRKDRSKTQSQKKNGKLISLNSASRATSMALRGTSVVAYTPASAYSSLLRTTITVTPVFGAALSLGIMACDAQNVYATIRKLQKPSDMALALVQIQKSFSTCIPTSVEADVLLILQVIRELEWLERQAAMLTKSSSMSVASGDSMSPNTSIHRNPPMYLETNNVPRSCMDITSPLMTPSTSASDLLAVDHGSSLLESADLASSSSSIQSMTNSTPVVARDGSFSEERKETSADLDDVKIRLIIEEAPSPTKQMVLDLDESRYREIESID